MNKAILWAAVLSLGCTGTSMSMQGEKKDDKKNKIRQNIKTIRTDIKEQESIGKAFQYFAVVLNAKRKEILQNLSVTADTIREKLSEGEQKIYDMILKTYRCGTPKTLDKIHSEKFINEIKIYLEREYHIIENKLQKPKEEIKIPPTKEAICPEKLSLEALTAFSENKPVVLNGYIFKIDGEDELLKLKQTLPGKGNFITPHLKKWNPVLAVTPLKLEAGGLLCTYRHGTVWQAMTQLFKTLETFTIVGYLNNNEAERKYIDREKVKTQKELDLEMEKANKINNRLTQMCNTSNEKEEDIESQLKKLQEEEKKEKK